MPEIRLHNTLTGKKEIFTPLMEGEVKMYNCGPTVYDYAHIGNLRSFIFADTLRRMFELNGYKVTQIINITDLGHLTDDGDEGEDKMTKALRREGKPLTVEAMKELADFYTEGFVSDLKKLNVESPTQLPRASEHLVEEIKMITTLLEKGIAYQISDGIYFDISKYEGYGKLGGLNLDKDDTTQSRVASNPEKKNPRDFALWKFGEIGFESPWGKGFPGWHLECSAMSEKYLGETFDIHTGGIDLSVVHHNNEIAQSEAAHQKPFVRYWLHHAFIMMEEEKMSKSKNNFFQLKDITDRNIPPLAYRLWLLGGHYRTPMNFTWDAVAGSQTALEKLYRFYEDLPAEEGAVDQAYQDTLFTLINDDLQTPQILALMWELVGDQSVSPEDKKTTLQIFDKVLGLGLANRKKSPIPEEILALVNKREEARGAGNFAEADLIRKQIEERGFILEDTPTGPKLAKR